MTPQTTARNQAGRIARAGGVAAQAALLACALGLALGAWAQNAPQSPAPATAPARAEATPPAPQVSAAPASARNAAAGPMGSTQGGSARPGGGSFLRTLTRWIDPNASAPLAEAQNLPEGQTAEGMEDALDRARKMGGEDAVLKSLGMGQPPEILQRQDEIERVLGRNPRWVWKADSPQGRLDPMLIPWIADKAIFATQDARARSLEGARQLEEALKIYEEMLQHVHEPAYASRVQARIDELRAKIEERDRALEAARLAAEQAAQQETAIPEPVLPQYVESETRGIVYDPSPGGVSLVSIGDECLRVGDCVPNYPEVVVKSIGYQTVVFTVSNEQKSKDFEIKVQGDAFEPPAGLSGQ